MILKRKELTEKLEELKTATGKSNLPFTTSFLYEEGTLYATNMISISAYTDIEADETLPAFIVDAKNLIDVIKKCPSSTVEITLEESTLKIVSNKYVTNLNVTLDIEPFPEIEKVWDEKAAFNTNSDFIKALNACTKIAAAAKDHDMVLRFVRLVDERIEASDGYRAVCYMVKTNTDETLVPGHQLENILKYTITNYMYTETEFVLKTENDVFFLVTKGTNEEYGDRVYRITHGVDTSKPIVLTNTQDIINAMDRVAVMAETFSGNKNKRCKFRFSKGQLKVMGDSDSGSAFETIELEYKGKNAQFTTSPQFVIDALEEKTQMVITDTVLFLFNPSYKCAIVIQQ